MTELPDFTSYEPVELSQVKRGDVVAAVMGSSIIHGAVTYATKYGLDLDNGFCATDKSDYKLFRAPKQLPTGECAVIEYKDKDGFEYRAINLGGEWFVLVLAMNRWDFAEDQPGDLTADTKDGFTVIFEGVKK